jgi:hypothetical protein
MIVNNIEIPWVITGGNTIKKLANQIPAVV